jgi:hypothetical protein
MLMLELRLRALLASLGVHIEAWALEEPYDLIDHNEFGVAFDSLCDNIYEADIAVFPGEVAEIESLGRLLGSDRKAWTLVRELMVGEP